MANFVNILGGAPASLADLDPPVGGLANFFNILRGAPAPLAEHGY